MTIAIVDVDYRGSGARAACVIAESWSSSIPLASHVVDIDSVEAYEPGAFYRRELPCLLQVLRLPASPPDVVVIDGYVWLSDASRAGLGAYLYQAMGARTPVIGVAKTAFHGAESCPVVASVLRGSSKKPLFVTATGMELGIAAALVRAMVGEHRIPALLAAADQLSRSGTAVGSDAGF